jgi:hypothetical protein
VLDFEGRGLAMRCSYMIVAVILGDLWKAANKQQPLKTSAFALVFDGGCFFRLWRGGGGEQVPPQNLWVVTSVLVDTYYHNFKENMPCEDGWCTPISSSSPPSSICAVVVVGLEKVRSPKTNMNARFWGCQMMVVVCRIWIGDVVIDELAEWRITVPFTSERLVVTLVRAQGGFLEAVNILTILYEVGNMWGVD